MKKQFYKQKLRKTQQMLKSSKLCKKKTAFAFLKSDFFFMEEINLAGLFFFYIRKWILQKIKQNTTQKLSEF